MHLTKSQKAVLALIVANIIWGAASPIFKWSLNDVGTFTLAFLRFFIAAYLLLPFTFKNLQIKHEHLFTLFLVSLFGITLNIALFFIALPYITSINVPIIGSSGPIMLLLFSAVFLHEKLQSKVINGMLLSLIGVLVIIVNPTVGEGVGLSVKGNLLLVGATISSVISTILAKKIAPHYDYKTISFWTFLFSSMMFLPFMLHEIRSIGFLTGIGVPGITGIIFGALLSSAAAYTLYQYSLKYMPANKVGIFTYIDPIAAVVIAVPLLHETITPSYMLGSILVFLGIYLAENRIHYHPIKMFRQMSEGLKSVI